MKNQRKDIKDEKPILIISREEAKNQLNERIDAGKKIKEVNIHNEADLDNSERLYKKWTEYNFELLKSIFTNETIAKEYSYASGSTSIAPDPIWGNPFPTLYSNFVNRITAKLDKLESIIGRIELFQVTKDIEGNVTENHLMTDNLIFIGHGRSKLWARLKVFLEDELKVNTVSYESESRVGDSIVPILEELLRSASFAILILTAEDETKDGKIRARQNVIHETGLFQGKLGFKKAIILRQEGIEDLTNLAGVQYIKFSDDNIEQTFYEVSRVLKREKIIK